MGPLAPPSTLWSSSHSSWRRRGGLLSRSRERLDDPVERVVGLWALGALVQTWAGAQLSQPTLGGPPRRSSASGLPPGGWASGRAAAARWPSRPAASVPGSGWPWPKVPSGSRPAPAGPGGSLQSLPRSLSAAV